MGIESAGAVRQLEELRQWEGILPSERRELWEWTPSESQAAAARTIAESILGSVPDVITARLSLPVAWTLNLDGDSPSSAALARRLSGATDPACVPLADAALAGHLAIRSDQGRERWRPDHLSEETRRSAAEDLADRMPDDGASWPVSVLRDPDSERGTTSVFAIGCASAVAAFCALRSQYPAHVEAWRLRRELDWRGELSADDLRTHDASPDRSWIDGACDRLALSVEMLLRSAPSTGVDHSLAVMVFRALPEPLRLTVYWVPIDAAFRSIRNRGLGR